MTRSVLVALGILAALAVGYQVGRQDHPEPPPVMQTYAPPEPAIVPSPSRILIVGPRKQMVIMVHDGAWEVMRVMDDGTPIGDLVRVNVETREVSFPVFPPARWTMRSGSYR